jgi:GTP-binding protein HflX
VKKAFYIPSKRSPDEVAYLVGVTLPGRDRDIELENLYELELLVRSAGAEVAGRLIQNRTRVDGATYIGGGKMEELIHEISSNGVNLVIFDDDLTPAQARNIEKRLKVNVIDRTELILDIFSRRARTKQAKLQVEIAQLSYALPRLRRLWDHLSRQAGGIGTRGPGEKQLESDRRRVRERIARLKGELEEINKQAGERRKRRRRLFGVTLVGYTNAGKSTLMNRLAGSRVRESNRLFSTLDSTTRRVEGANGNDFLLTDTIGFIRKLPPHLVASFRATLMDVREANLLLHLADVSREGYSHRIKTVNEVLEDVLFGRGIGEEQNFYIPTMLVVNKVDLIDTDGSMEEIKRRYPESIPVSAVTGEGTEELLNAIQYHMEKGAVSAEIEVPVADGKAIEMVERMSHVLKRESDGGRMSFDVRISRKNLDVLERWAKVRLKPMR